MASKLSAGIQLHDEPAQKSVYFPDRLKIHYGPSNEQRLPYRRFNDSDVASTSPFLIGFTR